jgi:hypothetical protein
MANNAKKVTSPKAAKAASQVLRDPRANKADSRLFRRWNFCGERDWPLDNGLPRPQEEGFTPVTQQHASFRRPRRLAHDEQGIDYLMARSAEEQAPSTSWRVSKAFRPAASFGAASFGQAAVKCGSQKASARNKPPPRMR